jgi:hypothetical protein
MIEEGVEMNKYFFISFFICKKMCEDLEKYYANCIKKELSKASPDLLEEGGLHNFEDMTDQEIYDALLKRDDDYDDEDDLFQAKGERDSDYYYYYYSFFPRKYENLKQASESIESNNGKFEDLFSLGNLELDAYTNKLNEMKESVANFNIDD